MSVYKELIKSNNKRENLKQSDANKNLIYNEDEFGNKKIIRPGEGSGGEDVKRELRIMVVDNDPENLVEGMIWVRRSLV